MFSKHITAGVIGSALLATAAFAQTPSTTTDTSTAPAATTTTTSSSASNNSSYTGNWRASKVVGLNVYNDTNESLGTINDLLTDKNGKIVAAVIGVGGFLGVGERYVAIPFEKIKFVNEPVASNTASSGGAMGSRPATTTGSTTGAAGTGGGMASTTTAATPAASAPNPWYPDHAKISGTKDELKAMTEFKYTNS